jgi:hypothetical protein
MLMSDQQDTDHYLVSVDWLSQSITLHNDEGLHHLKSPLQWYIRELSEFWHRHCREMGQLKFSFLQQRPYNIQVPVHWQRISQDILHLIDIVLVYKCSMLSEHPTWIGRYFVLCQIGGSLL